MAKPVIHMSEAEAANDFGAVMATVRAGAEVVIDGHEPIVVAMRSQQPPGRLLSESMASAEAHGSTNTLDGDFAHDLQAVIDSHREPLDPPA